MGDLLRNITLRLPNRDRHFGDVFLGLIAAFGERNGDKVDLRKSNASFVPNISFALDAVAEPGVTFTSSDHQLTIVIGNETGQRKESAEAYQSIGIDEFEKRITRLALVRLDHVGFNLPWFQGVHPSIHELRETFAERSVYCRFPTGEQWDFILPATESEIRTNVIDLTKERYPKLEIVSFEKSSTPLIQIDLSVREQFENIVTLFPEGIADHTLKNVWVYLTNPYGIDICFVVGEHQDGDWSEFFSGNRILT